MKGIFKKFDMLPQKKKMALVTAIVMTLSLIITIPAYAWFNEQKKAAELYKVEFPNALYLNAAHREDRMYFNMNAISPYKIDPVTGGLAHDNDGKVIPVTSQQYVFSVSGKNTQKYTLQLAHTNNNQFTYTIYPATENASKPSGVSDDYIVEYKLNANSRNENELGSINNDTYDKNDGTTIKYYVRSTSPVSTSTSHGYLNNVTTNPMKAKNNDTYYAENYPNSMTNVDDDDIPSYWLSDEIPVESDSNKKFCHYYVLEVTWGNRPSSGIENKETDMVYITAERK